MPRIAIATIAGLLFLSAWIAASMVGADYLRGLNVAVQFLYFALAGFVWVFPVRWLMLWAVHQR
jgi:hypothetical protein